MKAKRRNHRKNCTKLAIHPKEPNTVYLVNVSLTMLSGVGGAFDDDDIVYTDIYSIDGDRNKMKLLTVEERTTAVMKGQCPIGGVYGRNFGRQGDNNNQGISSFVGFIKERIVFRIFIYGDDWAGASYSIMELGELPIEKPLY